MKLTKLFTAVVLVAGITMVSCKNKSPKELIVNKWKVTSISGTQATAMPDSVKTQIYSSAVMEFTKDGKFMTTGFGSSKGGTYSVSDDGKTLTSTDDGSSTPDILSILEISKDKMIIEDKKGEMKVTFSAK